MAEAGTKTDIAVVGGGASGLAAALAANRCGAGVTILERLPRVGKKLLATGNGRCNLGNLDRDPGHYHGGMDPAPVLAAFPGEADYFRALGLYVRPDGEGRLYPASGQAASVLDALRLGCAGLGVAEVCGFAVRDIRAGRDGFTLTPEVGEPVTARRVILAAGGCAGPKFGTDGGGHTLARRLGHQITKRYPALAPVAVEPGTVRGLKGLRVDAAVTALRDGQVLGREAGQVQFAEKALSGICVFNLSALRPDELVLDLIPWCDDAGALLGEISTLRSGAALEDMLTGVLPKRVGQALIRSCTARPLTAPVSALTAGELDTLAGRITTWSFPALEGGNWDAAQVTAGGVSGIGPTLESPVVPGLYFAGEILDVHGDCGGFNLRWAWASGTAAGEHAARSLQ